MKHTTRKKCRRTLITSFLALSLFVLPMYVLGQTERKGKENLQAQRETKLKENEGTQNRESHKKAKDIALELADELIAPQVAVLAPKNVSDIFGRRIAHRYVAFL